MISLPGVFLALSGTALLAALVALWTSVRAAFGGGPGVVVETARDLPDHAQLVEEKHSLLRAIKDLEYERAVGKIGADDFARLDAAYRARAKQVLELLDRDVRPLYDEAERLIAAHRAGAGGGGGAAAEPARKKRAKGAKKPDAENVAPVESARDATDARDAKDAAPSASSSDPGGDPEANEDGPSLDDVLTGIRDGSITEVPSAPAHWPTDAKKMWTQTLTRALEERRAGEGRSS